MLLVLNAIVKLELEDVASIAALLYNILDYKKLGLKEIPQDKTCTEQPQQWH